MSPVKWLPLAIRAFSRTSVRSAGSVIPALMLTLLLSFSAQGQLSTNMQDMIHRIDSGEFSGNDFGGGRRGARGGGERHWIDGGRAYSTIEHGDLVRYDTTAGERTVLMFARELT